MSDASSPKFSVELGPSRALAAAFLLFYGGAVALALFLPLPVWLRLLTAAAIAVGAQRAGWRYALRRCHCAIAGIALTGEVDMCEVRTRDGAWRPARVLDSWVQPWLVILRVKRAGARWAESVIVPADAVSAEGLRRLRVCLRRHSAAG